MRGLYGRRFPGRPEEDREDSGLPGLWKAIS